MAASAAETRASRSRRRSTNRMRVLIPPYCTGSRRLFQKAPRCTSGRLLFPPLLKLDGCAHSLQFLLELLRLLLFHALLHHLGRGIHDVLRLLEAETGDLANCPD